MLILITTVSWPKALAESGGDPYFIQAALNQIKPAGRTTTLAPRPGGLVRIEADRQEKKGPGEWVAEGKVVVTYQETRLAADKLEYDEESGSISASDNVVITRGTLILTGDRMEYNVETGVGVLYNVRGRTDPEYYLEAARVDILDRTTVRVEKGFITACREAVPKWRFGARSATINTDSHAILRGSVFKVKQVPLLYVPWMLVPLEKKERSSGFLLPSTGTSTAKGRTVHGAFYQVLGRSADVTWVGDYFSKRGVGAGVRFRIRPAERTWLDFSSYQVADRIKEEAGGAGGAHISAQGETYLKGGFRGVVDLNLVSNIRFRQLFAQDFRAAANTLDKSVIFLTNNFDAHSINFLFARHESALPFRSLVVRNLPVVNFKTLGKRVSEWPFYFFLDASIEGLNRIQQPDRELIVLTPEFVQRLDLFPRLLIPFRQFAGISLSAYLGARDTFYSHSYAPQDTRAITGPHLNRRYLTAELTAKGPGFARIFRNSQGQPRFKHLIEPEILYRRIAGIDRFDRIIRFDEKEAIANTSEFEWALVNRFFIRQPTDTGATARERFYFRIGHKYFFDPSFGGALVEGRPNQFFPINTQTAFPYGALRRRFAPLSFLARWYGSWLYNAEARADYDLKAYALRNASLAGTLTFRKLYAAATYGYTKEIQLPGPERATPRDSLSPFTRLVHCRPESPTVLCDVGTYNSNQLQGHFGYGDPHKGFSGGVIYTYDLLGTAFQAADRSGKRHLLGSSTRLLYNWDCCGLALEAQQFSVGIRSETLFRFSFTLGGIGSFGTLRRPQSLF